MASRKIYLCITVLKDGSKGTPFFSCQHHFGTYLFKDFGDGEIRRKSMEKIASADDELCEYCAGTHYNEQFEKSRKRALSMLGSLLAEDPPQAP